MNSDVERVQLLNQRFYEALSGQNLVTMEKVWSHGRHVRCVHLGREVLNGWDVIRESWRTMFTDAICLTVKPAFSEAVVIGPMAIVTCRESISSFTLEGMLTTEAQATNIFEKSDGQWLLIHHHASPVARQADPTQD